MRRRRLLRGALRRFFFPTLPPFFVFAFKFSYDSSQAFRVLCGSSAPTPLPGFTGLGFRHSFLLESLQDSDRSSHLCGRRRRPSDPSYLLRR
jgi:hypothetical protein